MVRSYKKHLPPNWAAGVFVHCGLRFADFDGVRPFRAVGHFKSHFVTFAKFVERSADEFVGVEKEIFFLTIALDEPETLIGESGDCSF